LLLLLLPVLKIALLITEKPVDVARSVLVGLFGGVVHLWRESALLVRLVGCFDGFLLEFLLPVLFVNHRSLQEILLTEFLVVFNREQFVFREQAGDLLSLLVVHLLNQAHVSLLEILLLLWKLGLASN
jgi:hypothetical protein